MSEAEAAVVGVEDKDVVGTSQQALSAMRAAIDAKLRQDGVYEQIRELVHAKAASQRAIAQAQSNATADDPLAPSGENAAVAESGGDATAQNRDEEQLVRDVLESEVVQQLLQAVRSMKLQEPTATAGSHTHPDSNHATFVDDDIDVTTNLANHANGGVNDKDVYLFLRLAGGKAFVDQLLAGDEDDDGLVINADSECVNAAQLGQQRAFFRVVLTFQNQRQVSKDTPCSVDPRFDESFRFRIDKRTTRRVALSSRPGGSSTHHTPYDVDVVAPFEALCLVDEAVQIDVVKVTKRLVHSSRVHGARWHETSRELLAVHRFDWRRVLCSTLQLVHLPVTLVGKMKVPVGSLDVRVDVLHFKRSAVVARDAAAFLNKETLQRNTRNHAFYQYARRWWDSYRNDAAVYTNAAAAGGDERDGEHKHSSNSSTGTSNRSVMRLVKLFAEDDDGCIRMVCKFLTPIRAPDAIRSPSKAARFVSLLPFAAHAQVGSTRDETWRSLPAILSLGKGDAQDHALLLASLLLGCGLDAYVCIGTIATDKQLGSYNRHAAGNRTATERTEYGHVWVLTRGTASDDVMFWESVTGKRHRLRSSSFARQSYCSIDCVFSHAQFFANLQPRAWRLCDTSFDLNDASAWRALDAAMIAELPLGQPHVPLQAPHIAVLPALERAWTRALRQQISTKRRAAGVTTSWSDALSFYLLPALGAYERERLYGSNRSSSSSSSNQQDDDNALFQQAITRFVPAGHTFQGVPAMLVTTTTDNSTEQASVVAFAPADALATLEASSALATTLVSLHARNAQFGVAVRCFAYPEGLAVVWLMLAVSYESTSDSR